MCTPDPKLAHKHAKNGGHPAFQHQISPISISLLACQFRNKQVTYPAFQHQILYTVFKVLKQDIRQGEGKSRTQLQLSQKVKKVSDFQDGARPVLQNTRCAADIEKINPGY